MLPGESWCTFALHEIVFKEFRMICFNVQAKLAIASPAILACVSMHLVITQLIACQHVETGSDEPATRQCFGAFASLHGRLVASLCRDVTGATGAGAGTGGMCEKASKRRNLQQALTAYIEGLRCRQAKAIFAQIRTLSER